LISSDEALEAQFAFRILELECHSEQSEESIYLFLEILHYIQNDKVEEL